MIELALSSAELQEILEALVGEHGERYASPSLVHYLDGKKKEAKYAEERDRREKEHGVRLNKLEVEG